jgi:hypothetical protein
MVIFNQREWEKEEIKGGIDKDEGEEITGPIPPSTFTPLESPAACSRNEGHSLLGANPVRDLSLTGRTRSLTPRVSFPVRGPKFF